MKSGAASKIGLEGVLDDVESDLDRFRDGTSGPRLTVARRNGDHVWLVHAGNAEQRDERSSGDETPDEG